MRPQWGTVCNKQHTCMDDNATMCQQTNNVRMLVQCAYRTLFTVTNHVGWLGGSSETGPPQCPKTHHETRARTPQDTFGCPAAAKRVSWQSGRYSIYIKSPSDPFPRTRVWPEECEKSCPGVVLGGRGAVVGARRASQDTRLLLCFGRGLQALLVHVGISTEKRVPTKLGAQI